MHLSSFLLPLLFAALGLISLAAADSGIYLHQNGRWMVLTGDSSCEGVNKVSNYAVWHNKPDLSHGRLGFCCEGGLCILKVHGALP